MGSNQQRLVPIFLLKGIIIIKFTTLKTTCCVHAQSLSSVGLFATPWTVTYQAPLSMEFSRQEYWSKLPFPILEDLPNPWIEPVSLARNVDEFFTTVSLRKPLETIEGGKR